MKTWADFVPEIVMYVADCPHFTIADRAHAAAIEFYRDSRAWRSTLPLTLATTVANQGQYTITNPAGQELVGLPAAWLDDAEIPEALPGDVNGFSPGEVGTKHSLLLVSGTIIQLLPATATAGQVIKAQVAYGPTPAATGLDDELYAKHLNTLRELILCRLKYMQGKPWSNVSEARLHDLEYQRRALDDGTAAGPVRRNRLRTRLSKI